MVEVKVSIIVATYNSEITLADTLDSILLQDFRNFEILIQDGGSNDKTLEIAKGFNDPRIVIYQEKDNGLYDAMNKGLSKASGDIIGILNSDDVYYDQNVLSKIVSAFANNQAVDVVYGNLWYVSHDLKNTLREWKSKAFDERLIYSAWQPPHPTVYLRNIVYNKVGKFDTDFSVTADFDLLFRIFFVHKLSSLYIDHILVKMRVGGVSNESWSARFSNLKEYYQIYNKHGFKILPIFAIVLRVLGRFTQFKLI